MYNGECGNGHVGVMGFFDDFYPCGGASGVNLLDGAWHMVAAVYDGAGTLSLYEDGNLDNQASHTYATTGRHNYIGRSNHEGFERSFKGSIDDVAIFDYALTAGEISLLANP